VKEQVCQVQVWITRHVEREIVVVTIVTRMQMVLRMRMNWKTSLWTLMMI